MPGLSLRCSTLPYDYALRESLERLVPTLPPLRVFCLESLDRTIDDLFEILNERGTPELLETLCPYFGTVWPAARALTLELMSEPRLEGERVLELGCGLALPSLAASLRGARPVATDCHPDIRSFLELNLKANPGSSVEYRALDWRTETLGETFDRVIASDVLYEKHQPEIVARAIAEGLRPGGRFMLTDPGRPYLQDFSDAMERRGLPVRIQTLTVPDPGAETPPVEGRTRDVFVLSGSRLLQ